MSLCITILGVASSLLCTSPRVEQRLISHVNSQDMLCSPVAFYRRIVRAWSGSSRTMNLLLGRVASKIYP
jgi:hypothetical protein